MYGLGKKDGSPNSMEKKWYLSRIAKFYLLFCLFPWAISEAHTFWSVLLAQNFFEDGFKVSALMPQDTGNMSLTYWK